MKARASWRNSALWSVFGLFWSLALIQICLGFDPIGVLTPRDSEYLVGSNVTLECGLFVKQVEYTNSQGKTSNISVNSSNLSITTKRGSLASDKISIINDSAIRYSIIKGGIHDSLTYYCNLNLPSGKPQFIHISNITFGYPPTDVLNFKCRSYEYRNLTCWWTPEKNTVSVNYTLARTKMGFTRKCYPAFSNPNWCQYSTMKGSPFYDRYETTLSMSLEGNGTLGFHNQFFQLNHYALVVPGRAKDVVIDSTGYDHLTLTWKPPEGMDPGSFNTGVCYRLLYKTQYEQEFQFIEVGSKTSYVLHGLRPNTAFSLLLQGRSCASTLENIKPDLWSDNVTLEASTKPDVPWSPPDASVTSFDVVTFNNSRNITLYWKPVPKMLQNAGGFRYFVTCNKVQEDGHRQVFNVTTYQSWFTFIKLETDSEYEFWIYSVNDIGSSVNFTTIKVERTDKMPSRPTNVWPISKGNGRYTVSWSATTVQSVGSYMLVWCQRDRPGEYRCSQHIEWMYLPFNVTTIDLHLEDHNYYFAVSAMSSLEDDVGSGLEWAPCTVSVNKVLDSVHRVNLIAVNPQSLNVSWKLDCEVQKAVILQYHIYYCPTKCPVKSCVSKGMKNVIVAEPLTERVQLTGLEPFTDYGVSVVALTAAGRSEQSEVHCHKTLHEAPSDPPHVYIQNTTNNGINISWKAPEHPNGIITHYVVYYRNTRNNVTHSVVFLTGTIRENYMNAWLGNLSGFTNYSVVVSACVNYSCSNGSDPQNVLTEIGVPGPMEPPRIEYYNSSHLMVSWKAPEIANGPLDLYLLHIYSQEGDNMTHVNRMNVTGTSVPIKQNCPTDSRARNGNPHIFRIQAVNINEGPDIFYGPLSGPSKNKICFIDGDILDYSLVIGIIVGSTFGLALFIVVLYIMFRRMKSRVEMMKDIKVQLPSGLETPYSNTLNPYEVFSGNLTSRGSNPDLSHSDSNPYRNADFKNRHGSGASHYSTGSTEELLSKLCPGGNKSAANIVPSSVATTSAEVEHNLSGDSSSGVGSLSSFPVQHSAESTEDPSCSHGPRSRDSGIEEVDGKFNKIPGYLSMDTYSKLGILGSGYIPIAKGHHNLTNSEPSIRDLYQDSRLPTEPPSPDVPYSKFGLSRSETDLNIKDDLDFLDSPQPQKQEVLSYSHFGLPKPTPQSPYVTIGMALLTAPKHDLRENLLDICEVKKEEPPEIVQNGMYSKLGLGPVPISKGYVTLKDIEVGEKNHTLPDLAISAREESQTGVSVPMGNLSSKSGYLPHKMVSNMKSPSESYSPVLPDVVKCSSVLPLSTMLQEVPEGKEINNGYITLNQVLTSSSEV